MIDSSAHGTSALAAAIHHPVTRRVIGTVSVAGPTVRLTEPRILELGPELLKSAAELSDASIASSFLSEAARAPQRAPAARKKA